MFDTNAISALVHHRKGFEHLARTIEELPVEQRLISTITLSELETMIAKAADPMRKAAGVRVVLSQFNAVDFDESAAWHAGRIRAHLEPRGLIIGPLDTLIAAHAKSLAVPVVTDNTGEFSRVPGLVVENWRR